MTKLELLDMIKDMPDDTEFGVRSHNGSIEVEFRPVKIFGGHQNKRIRPIDYVFETK